MLVVVPQARQPGDRRAGVVVLRRALLEEPQRVDGVEDRVLGPRGERHRGLLGLERRRGHPRRKGGRRRPGRLLGVGGERVLGGARLGALRLPPVLQRDLHVVVRGDQAVRARLPDHVRPRRPPLLDDVLVLHHAVRRQRQRHRPRRACQRMAAGFIRVRSRSAALAAFVAAFSTHRPRRSRGARRGRGPSSRARGRSPRRRATRRTPAAGRPPGSPSPPSPSAASSPPGPRSPGPPARPQRPPLRPKGTVAPPVSSSSRFRRGSPAKPWISLRSPIVITAAQLRPPHHRIVQLPG